MLHTSCYLGRDSAAYLVCILTFLCVMANSVVSL